MKIYQRAASNSTHRPKLLMYYHTPFVYSGNHTLQY